MDKVSTEYHLVRYTPAAEADWDNFIYNQSYNGNFSVSRNFLNYHPPERFIDHSLLIYKGAEIVAVVPACELNDNGKKVFYSHRGSTFGGLVVSRDYFVVKHLQNLILALEDYLKAQGFNSVVLRQVSDIFSHGSVDSLDYLLRLNGFAKYEELSFVVDITKINQEDIVNYFRWNTAQQARQSLNFGLTLRELENDGEVKEFHRMLAENLKRHDATPVHTAAEFLDLQKRLPEVVKFFGCFKDDKMIGSAMTWLYNQNSLHLQNICIDYDYHHLRPNNFMNYHFIKMCRDNDWRYYSFGICTEDKGNKLNFGLAGFKEGFRAQGFINKIFFKDF